MHSSYILSPRKLNYLILGLIALIVSTFTILPLLKTGASGVFFAIDPDVVYMANALSFIKTNQIYYFDHPGTLAIVLISASLLPLKISHEFLSNTSFLSWIMENYYVIFLYERIFQTFLFWISLIVYLISIFKYSGSFISSLFAILALLSFSAFPYLGISISSETTSFLLISLWLFALTEFLRGEKTKQIFTMCLIAGLAFGNRATNFFLVPASLILVFAKNTHINLIKLKLVLVGLLVSTVGFFISIWPLKHKFILIMKRILLFAGSTRVHGGGERTIFDLTSYIDSLKTFVGREDLPVLLTFLTFMGILVSVSYGVRKEKPINILGIIFLIGFIIFAKFPLSHYQLANYTVLVFIASYLFSKFSINLKLAILGLMLIFVIPKLQSYHRIVSWEISKSFTLESFQKSHPAGYASVWEWARSRDFSLIWTRAWGGGLFSEELKDSRPDLLELITGFEKIKLASGEEVGVFDACWDHLYIQNESLPTFLAKYPEKSLEITPVEGSGNIVLVSSDHCTTKP